MEHFEQSMLELITQTSTNLPPDVRTRMAAAMAAESAGSQAASALDVMAINVDMALANAGPICQDTGMPTFEIRTPMGTNQLLMKQKIVRPWRKPPGRASCVPIPSIPSPERTAATTSARDAGHPLEPVGERGRDRSQAAL